MSVKKVELMKLQLTDIEHVYPGRMSRRWPAAGCRSCGSNAGHPLRKYGSMCPSSICTFQKFISKIQEYNRMRGV